MNKVRQDITKAFSANKQKKNSKEGAKMMEPIIAVYKVTPLGGMQRLNQVPCEMGRKFYPSRNGNMVLQRSKDKKVVSITNFDATSPTEEYFKTLAWTNKLKKFETPDEFTALNIGMNNYYHLVRKQFDELVEVSFVGNSKFVQLIYIEAQARSLIEQQLYEQ